MNMEEFDTYRQKTSSFCKVMNALSPLMAPLCFFTAAMLFMSPVVGVILLPFCVLWVRCVFFKTDQSGGDETRKVIEQRTAEDKNEGYCEKLSVYVPPDQEENMDPKEIMMISPGKAVKIYQPVFNEARGRHSVKVIGFDLDEVSGIDITCKPDGLTIRGEGGRFTLGGLLIAGAGGALVGAAIGSLVEEIAGPKNVDVSARIEIKTKTGEKMVFTPVEFTCRVASNNIDATHEMLVNDVAPHLQHCVEIINSNFPELPTTA